jgi:hypothetical protein
MKSTAIVILTLGTILQSFGQTGQNDDRELEEFYKLIKSRPIYSSLHETLKQDSIGPVVFRDVDYQIRLADKGLNLEENLVVLKNPHSDSDFPLSFSVIYKDRIISLFEPGKFACYDLSMNRDLELEKKLNKMTFKYHWIIDNKLVAKSGGTLYTWNDDNEWESFQKKNPMNKQPKLFEDDRFIVYFQCQGEFGGTIYFYDKQSKNVHITEATCPNSVLKQNGKYLVLSTLGHMMGSVDLKSIENPTMLPRLKDIKKSKLSEMQKYNIGYADSSNYAKNVFEYYDMLAFSSFVKDDKVVYWVHWKNFNFLAEINNNVISIVDPLFMNDEIYTHNPVTTMYNNGLVFINLDFYGIGGEREVSFILVEKDRITKVDWGQKH